MRGEGRAVVKEKTRLFLPSGRAGRIFSRAPSLGPVCRALALCLARAGELGGRTGAVPGFRPLAHADPAGAGDETSCTEGAHQGSARDSEGSAARQLKPPLIYESTAGNNTERHLTHGPTHRDL